VHLAPAPPTHPLVYFHPCLAGYLVHDSRMKLTLRPEWRLWPFTSALGLLDLKTGVTVTLLFVLLNKVAGVYGLIAVLTGAGGSFAQLSLYVYSAVALVALGWGLNAVKKEDPKQTLYFAHLFFADHILSTAWTVFFAVTWWFFTPHDGRRQANSKAQEEMMKTGVSIDGHTWTKEERVQAAMVIWNKEKGTAATVIAFSWLAKIYFAALLYSYATHLRRGSYRSLPNSRPNPTSSTANASSLADDEDEEIEDFYRVPLRTPGTGGSISSFADFVGAPGRPRKSKTRPKGDIPPLNPEADMEEEVLFDEDETLPRVHSKMGTEESNSASSREDEW